ncbi:MAG TPA: hypothetical protein PLC08_03495 [Candidatus Bipolaricaulis sp.]|nr:hypothetical protein [Candidatus Bipolaricaulis sp.]HRS14404.1 hypothetical protein [Candidatus Bipolaricaulis sp.]HRU21222.1 hypothetical protein [Candidatus Bipolaricaulis sp.]
MAGRSDGGKASVRVGLLAHRFLWSGVFLFGLTLRFKDAESLLNLVGNVAPLLGGMFLPIAFLPGFLRPVSLFAMPVQLAVLAALGLVYLVLGWWALGRFEQSSRHHGLEGF